MESILKHNAFQTGYLTEAGLHQFIDQALEEDIGSGDVSSLSSVPSGLIAEAELKIKEEGILAGIDLARKIFHRFDPGLEMEAFLQDGDGAEPGLIVSKYAEVPVRF